MKGFAIKNYSAELRRQFVRYVGEAFYNGYILGEKKYLSWQYKYGGVKLLLVGKRVVGHYGYIDLVYLIKGQKTKVRVFANLAVLPEFRSSGAGSLLLKSLIKKNGCHFIFGFNDLSNKLMAHFSRQWKEVGKFNRYFFIFNKNNALFSGLKLPVHSPLKKLFLKEEVLENFVSWGEYKVFWNRVKKFYPNSVFRDQKYLEWRFFKNPFFKYRFIGLSAGCRLQGVVFWKVEEDGGFKIARIIDAFGFPESNGALFSAFLSEAEKSGADAADFMFSGDICRDGLQKAGFFNVRNTALENFPILFTPISKKKTSINFGSDIPKLNNSSGFFTKADGDQDRPNNKKTHKCYWR